MATQPPPTLPQMDMFAQPNVHQHPSSAPRAVPSFRIEPEPGPAREEDVGPALLEMAQAIARICATRILLLLAVITASGVWSFCVYDPTQLRIAAAGVFSLMTVFPLVFLYLRKG
jgi:hypothetical protein